MQIARPAQSSFTPIIAINALFLTIIGFSSATIGVLDFVLGWQNWQAFAITSLITSGIGIFAYYLQFDSQLNAMSMRQVLIAMISSWITACLFSAIPFLIGAPYLNFSHAIFESVSALTTTGATVMTNIDNQPNSILLWRSLLHWLGGMGVVIGAMVLFPAMRIGGMQFFLRAGSETEDKIMPSAQALGRAVFSTYSTLTLFCMIGYLLMDMPTFDALNMAMSTMATGGLAVSDASFAIYSDGAHIVGTIFMLIAGMPLIVHLLALRGQIYAYKEDLQIWTYLKIYAVIAFMIIGYRLFQEDISLSRITIDSTFNTASLLTGTGFTNGDFQLWGAFPTVLLLMAMFIGGCTGSTAGSIKIFRFQILIELVRVRIQRIQFPSSIINPKYGGEKVSDQITESVAAYFIIYIATLAIATIIFDLFGLDFITAFSSAVSSVGNIGPGLGNQIGPVGNYSQIQEGALWTFTICMLLGRLEFMSFFVLVLPRFWRV